MNTTKTQELVAKKLKALIKENFKQQKIFAKEVGISEDSIVQWLKKGVMPSLTLLDKIANHCNIHISYFFTDDSNSNAINEKLFNQIFKLA